LRPPIKRINWEYKKLISELADKKILIDVRERKLSKEEFIKKYNRSLWEYLYSIYSYDNNCSIKIIKIDDSVKEQINAKISHEYSELERSPVYFDEDDVEVNQHYISKIDRTELGYEKIWYVLFKNSKYPFGFDQEKEYIQTIKENIFFVGNLLILRGQSSNLPSLKNKFLIDFGLQENNIEDITLKMDLLDAFNRLKESGNLELKTHEVKKDNPFSAIQASHITFSEPMEDGDLDDIVDEESEIAKLLSEAEEISKTLSYTYEDDSGFKENAKISIGKGSKSVRIMNKISDMAIFALAGGIVGIYDELQQNADNLLDSESDSQ